MASKYLKSLQYFTVIGKLLGITQFSIIGPGNDYVDVLHCVPFFAVYIYISIRAFADIELFTGLSKDTASSTGFYILLAQHTISVITKIIFFYIRRKFVKDVFYKIDQLNATLKLQQDNYKWENLHMLVVMSLATGINCYIEVYKPTAIWLTLLHQLTATSNYLEIALMYKMLNELSKQCQSINERLQKRISFLALDKIQPKGKIWNELLDVKKLRENEKDSFFDNAFEMAETHLAIGQIAREVNSIFAISVMFGVLSDFTTLTMTTVDFCQQIRRLITVGYVDTGIMILAFNCALRNAQLLVKECYGIYYWTKLKKNLKFTITCLHKMWNTLAKHNEIDEKSNYLQLLIVQLFNGMPTFSAYGIITIDWPLIILVISSAATYVVIIMQFQLATNP